jgi:hypothetical protein
MTLRNDGNNQAGGSWQLENRAQALRGAYETVSPSLWPRVPKRHAGRDDLFVLLCVVSLAPSNTDRKMAHVLALWAPWMQLDEAEMYVEHINRLTIYEWMPAAKELGERLNLTNAERERLRLWPIAPIDMTDEQLAEQRKAKAREREESVDKTVAPRRGRLIWPSSRASNGPGKLMAYTAEHGRDDERVPQSRPHMTKRAPLLVTQQ